ILNIKAVIAVNIIRIGVKVNKGYIKEFYINRCNKISNGYKKLYKYSYIKNYYNIFKICF
ncbi:hypothetical protein VAMP_16n1, partial [Candidatus Vampirococcus lugosii]|nr:hypothetical protein [Candidatus Vampirococcus lugosii]